MSFPAKQSHKTTDIRLTYDKLRFCIFAHATHYFTIKIKLHVAVILAKTKFLVIGKICANVFTNSAMAEGKDVSLKWELMSLLTSSSRFVTEPRHLGS